MIFSGFWRVTRWFFFLSNIFGGFLTCTYHMQLSIGHFNEFLSFHTCVRLYFFFFCMCAPHTLFLMWFLAGFLIFLPRFWADFSVSTVFWGYWGQFMKAVLVQCWFFGCVCVFLASSLCLWLLYAPCVVFSIQPVRHSFWMSLPCALFLGKISGVDFSCGFWFLMYCHSILVWAAGIFGIIWHPYPTCFFYF